MLDKIKNKDLNQVDSLETYFEFYDSVSIECIDQYLNFDSLTYSYKDDLRVNHKLLNYFPENISNNEYLDTLEQINIEKNIMPNVNNNILPNLNIKMDSNE